MSKNLNNNLKYKSKLNKFNLIIIMTSAFSIGFAWRVRGDFGFGGVTGMIVPSLLLTVLILIRFEYKFKYNSIIIGLVITLMSVTANGWGTINGQITGILSAPESPGVAGYNIKVNPISGAFLMFCVGFGWIPLWALMIGYIFSNKEYKWFDIIKGIFIYVIFRILGEVFLAHLIVRIIAPHAYVLFADSLKESGLNITPWSAYLSNYFNQEWYETIAGGRNYAANISNLSSCIGVIAIYLFLRFYYKDKIAAKIELMLSLIFGISILIADFWMFWDLGGLWRESLQAPEWVLGWTYWEYSTGFLAGGLSMYYLTRFSKSEIQINESNRIKNLIDLLPNNQKFNNILYIFIVIGFINIYGLVFPFWERLSSESVLNIQNTLIKIIFLSICILSLLIFGVLNLKGKIKIKLESNKMLFYWFIIYLVIYFTIYIFVGNLYDWTTPMNYIMVISFVISLISIIYFFNFELKNLKK